MADYGQLVGRAESLYGNQWQQEQTASDQAKQQSDLALNTEQQNLGTTYAQNLASYGTQRSQQGDNAAFQASTHGLYGSGLAQNMQNKVMADYQTNVQNLNQLRADKLMDIAGRRQLSQQGYDASRGALWSKYQALKAEYINAGGEAQNQLNQQNAMYQAQMKSAYGK